MQVSGTLPLNVTGILSRIPPIAGQIAWRRQPHDYFLRWSVGLGVWLYGESYPDVPDADNPYYAPVDGGGPTGIFWPGFYETTGTSTPELPGEFFYRTQYEGYPVYGNVGDTYDIWRDPGNGSYYITAHDVRTHAGDEDWWESEFLSLPWGTYAAGGTASGSPIITQTGLTGIATIRSYVP